MARELEKDEVMGSLSDALGMNPLILPIESTRQLTPVIEDVGSTELSKEDKEVETDFYEVRENYKDIIEQGKTALTDIVRIAKASESPRAFEVASKMLKDLSDINSQLLTLHEKRRQLVPVTEPEKEAVTEAQVINNNNVFVGTTRDLLDLYATRRAEAAAANSVIEHDDE